MFLSISDLQHNNLDEILLFFAGLAKEVPTIIPPPSFERIKAGRLTCGTTPFLFDSSWQELNGPTKFHARARSNEKERWETRIEGKEQKKHQGGPSLRVRSSWRERDVPGTLAIVALFSLGFTVQLTFCRLLLRTARRFIRLAYTYYTRTFSTLSIHLLAAFPVPPLSSISSPKFLSSLYLLRRTCPGFEDIDIGISICDARVRPRRVRIFLYTKIYLQFSNY